MLKKHLFKISIIVNAVGVFGLLFVFFYLGGSIFWVNKVENIFNGQAKAAITRIREDNLQLVGDSPVDIVFAGDSHTNYFEWAEYFDSYSVANRGIGSDTSEGLLNRIGDITKMNPKKIFIMIGVNDLQKGEKPTEIKNNLMQIVEIVNRESPDTKIFIESILPVNDNLFEQNFYKKGAVINVGIKETNDQLSQIQGVTYIDLSGIFGNELNEDFTVDGIHLSEKGYQAYLDTISPYVVD